MVARNARARKAPAALKGVRGPIGASFQEWVGDPSALAARISTSIVCTAGDTALCLARQAGPGPRM